MTTVKYNPKCAGVKRLMREAMELREPTELFFAQPMEDNLFEWHFTVRGAEGSVFEGGFYHGRMVFPVEYPMKPPNMTILTPNGRFELHKKICLSISGYHPETWLPSWSIRTALLALIGFMPTQGGGALGSIDYPDAERIRLAKLSVNWSCNECKCGKLKHILLPLSEDGRENTESVQLASKLKFQDENEVKKQVEKLQESNDESGTSQSPTTVQERPQQIAQQQRPEETISNQDQETDEFSSSTRYYVFVVAPITFVALSCFIMLLCRRLLTL